MPAKLDRCVRKQTRKGVSKSRAYGRCVKSTGWARKKGGGWKNKKTGKTWKKTRKSKR